jgi:uncharacterized protein
VIVVLDTNVIVAAMVAKGLCHEVVVRGLEQLRLRVRIAEPAPLGAPVSRDADDDVVLATAVAAGAALMVTGDRDLLVIGRHNGIDIVSPRDFLKRFSS